MSQKSESFSPLRIYADFNGLVRGVRDSSRTAVVIDTFGSLRDLANAGVILSEGLPIITVDWSDEVEDLEGHGTAHYDHENNWWVVEFDEQGVRYVPAGDRSPVTQFLCVNCRSPLPESVARTIPRSTCPACGTNLLLPIGAPKNDA